MLLAACWLVAWPYLGILQDARLYAVEALGRLHPEVYARDLSLAFGSQGQFTIFPRLFSALIDAIGLDQAAWLLASAGKLLWLAGIALLARTLQASPVWVFGFALILAYPAYYDANTMLSYGESFATPRIYAEALTLFALSAWLGAQRGLALVLIAGALLMHPLMALPGACVLGVLALIKGGRSARVWIGLVALVAVGVLALSHPEVFGRLFMSFDAEWFGVIALRNSYVFLDQWDSAAWGRVVFLLVALGLAARDSRSGVRNVALAMLGVTLTLLVLSWFGAGVWKNVLLTQLQLWRVLWLAQILALLLLAGMLPGLWRGGYADRILAACLAAAFLLDGWSAGLLAVGGVGLRALLQRAKGVNPNTLFWKVLPFLIVLPWLLLQLAAIPWSSFDWRVALGDRVIFVALAGLLYLAARESAPPFRKLFAVVAGFALLGAILAWAPNVFRGSAPNAVYEAMRRDIPPGAVVASAAPSGLAQTWFSLRRAGYANKDQVAGMLFSREEALEGRKRLERLRQAGFPNSDLEWDKKNPRALRPIPVAAVRSLCQDPVLDFVVLEGKAERATVYYSGNKPVMSLYACEPFREGSPVPLQSGIDTTEKEHGT